MRFLIRTWARQGGERVPRDRMLDTEHLRIGRGTDQDIQLPDLRVAIAHAELVRSGKNAVIVSRSGDMMLINGAPVTEHKLHGGDTVILGRFRLVISPGKDGADLQVEVEETISARDEKSQRHTRLSMSLDEAGLSRRRLAWLLFFLVLLPGLAIPAYLRYQGPPSRAAAPAADYTPPPQAPAWKPTDRIWVPGHFSSFHSFFSNDCAKCHEVPFVRVRNEACLSCHKDTAQHVDDPHLLQMPVFAQARCEDCHHEHKGDAALVSQANLQCTDCHAQPQLRFADSKMPPATSFSQKHPVFTPKVARYDPASRQFRWMEASQDQPATLHSDTNLKYPHDKHLNPKGIKSPHGTKVLVCGDCHQPDASGISFKPIDMPQHCAECHRLDFDPDEPDRLLPHAQPTQVAGVIRDFYARAALTGGVHKPGAPEIVQLRRKPGEQLSPPQARAALEWADRQSAIVEDEVFDKRVCGYCHTVQRTGDPALPWSIEPVTLGRHRLEQATFSHAEHRTEKCESCHAATTSKLSTDVLLPDLKRCRDCHGDPGSSARIQSNCLECHGYHVAREQQMGAPIKTVSATTATTEHKP
ncbi:MAG: FHA domain-containing protein [Nevskia sp.]|nr:FHA domain-containing protein [Nevskia sp.]